MSFVHALWRTVLLLTISSSVTAAQVSVSLPIVQGRADTTLTIPLTVGNLTGLGVTAYQCVITFDTAVVRLTGFESAGTLSANFMTMINTLYPGELRLASAGFTPMVGAGTLLNIKVELRKAGTSSLSFLIFKFNEGTPVAATSNGKITVLRPNQKPVIVARLPGGNPTVVLNEPITFALSAYDPEGAPLTYTWKQDGVVVKSGADSTYTTTFAGKFGDPHFIVCVVSDPSGLQDSATWNFIITDIAAVDGEVPAQFALSQNYPNPFNPTTTIHFELAEEAPVTLEVYSILGVRVRALLRDERIHAGRHAATWDGRDEAGVMVPSGAYLYSISAGVFHSSRKMTLLK